MPRRRILPPATYRLVISFGAAAAILAATSCTAVTSLFKPKPIDLAVLSTNDTLGYIEPCG